MVTVWCCLAGVVLVTGPTAGQEEPMGNPPQTEVVKETQTADEPGMFDLWSAKRLTGDWGGVRTSLEEAGIKFKIKLMNEFMVNMYGGRETRNGHDFAGSYELDLTLDFDKMGLVPGGSLFIQTEGDWGGDDSDFDKEKIGGLFKTNQDAGSEEPIYVDKWWWKQKLADGRLEVRLGRLQPHKDLFDTSKIMGSEDDQFLNRALVFNGTFPAIKGLGAYVNWNMTEKSYVRAAAIDAHSRPRQTNFNTAFHDEDEFRAYFEMGCRPELSSAGGDLGGHYRVGTWYDPTRKKRFFNTLGGLLADRYDSGDWGFYFGFDQMVWQEEAESDDKQGFSVAGRYGYAHGEVNKIEHFWAFAAQYQGLIEGRDKDVLAFGVAQGILADEYRRVHQWADRETVYELYYAYHVTPWLIISPDFQFITNAGADKDDRNAAVFGLRLKMSL